MQIRFLLKMDYDAWAKEPWAIWTNKWTHIYDDPIYTQEHVSWGIIRQIC